MEFGVVHRLVGCWVVVQALEGKRRVLPPHHPELGISNDHLGCLYFDKGDFHKAGLHFEAAAGIFSAALGPDSQRTQDTLHNLRLARENAAEGGEG